MKKIMLFTTSMCPKCPEAKDYMSRHHIDCEFHICDEDETSMELAISYGIREVPTVVEEENGESKITLFNQFILR